MEKVWLLMITHRHGVDVSVYASPADAEFGLSRYVGEWWETDGPDETMPEDKTEAIAAYFAWDGADEDYSIKEKVVLGS